MITVVVADDQPLVRAGIVMLLRSEPDLDVVAEAQDGLEAVALVRARPVDVVVMDVRMPGIDGIDATRQIVSERQDGDLPTRVLVLTTFDEDEAVFEAIRSGASGMLLKHAAPRELALAVRAVAAGDSWLDSRVAGRVIDAFGRLPAVTTRPDEALARLSPREREVLVLMSHGLTNADIAHRLVLSDATVKTHVSRILLKTGSHDRSQAVVMAYQGGLVVAGQPLDPL